MLKMLISANVYVLLLQDKFFAPFRKKEYFLPGKEKKWDTFSELLQKKITGYNTPAVPWQTN